MLKIGDRSGTTVAPYKHKSPAVARLSFESCRKPGFRPLGARPPAKPFSALPEWQKTHSNVEPLLGLAKHKLRQTRLDSEAELTNLELISGHDHVVQIRT